MSARPVSRPIDLLPTAVSGLLALLMVVLGARLLYIGHMLPLFGASMIVIGVLAVVLTIRAARGHRAAWAHLVALWGVVGFCAFFSAPKVISLGTLKQVTPEMELTLGRAKAEATIDDENFNIRLTNLGWCALFALPFGVACGLLASRGRDLERRI